MKKLGIEKADIGSKRAVLHFSGTSKLYGRFSPSGRMEAFFERPDPLGETKKLLENLKPPEAGNRKQKDTIKRR
jgi:hypothetical protein